MANHANRRSMRLKNYDYATPAAYFITICAYERRELFADTVLAGLITTTLQVLPERFSTVELDECMIMPNHLHSILWLRARASSAPTIVDESLMQVVRAFKSLIAVQWLQWIREHEPERSAKIWQRGFYERIIRNETELNAIRQYIRDNPQRWAENRDNLDRLTQKMTPRVGAALASAH